MRDLKLYYVFVLREAVVDENGYGPTYQLVANRNHRDGCWTAATPSEAITQAAQGRDDIYAAAPRESFVVDRWPLTNDYVSGQREKV